MRHLLVHVIAHSCLLLLLFRLPGLFLLSLHNNRGKHAYGIEAFETGNPLAWPSFATEDDVRGLPPTVINT